MKKAILFIAMLVAATTAVRGQISYGAPNDWFVTVWDISKPTNRTYNNPASTIAVPTRGTNYTLYWEDVDQTTTNGILNISTPWSPYYLPVPSGTKKVRIKIYKGVGAITGLFEAWSTDSKRLIAVEQWGTNVWTNLVNAFKDYPNMDVTATDIPNLSACQNVSNMFYNCTSLVNGNGSISGWQTANVTNMRCMFYGAAAFNQALNNWNTQSVTNMGSMFNGAAAFNQPLNNWNTQNVTNMGYMFSSATAFNQALNDWNTQSVTDMGGMFYSATAFNQPLNNWKTQNVTNMGYMFSGATAFNQPIGNWNTQSVTNMSGMFAKGYGGVGNMSFNQDISSWNTANVTGMSSMFDNNIVFNQPIGNWNTQSVTDMSSMFYRATAFNQPLSNWNTQSVTNMKEMFYGATAFNKPIGNWNTANVNIMTNMFNGAVAFNKPIGNWNTQSVTNMSGMFSGATAFNQDLSSWDVSKVTDMSYMFSGATAFNGNVNGWGNKMKNVANIKWMFQGARAFNQSLEGWVLNSGLSRVSTEKILFGSGMQCQNLTATLNGWAKNSEFNPSTIGNTIEIDFSGVVYSRTARGIMRYLRQNKGINILEAGYYFQDCDGINFDQYTIKVDTRRDATGGATPTNRAININVVGTNFSVTYTDVSNPWNTGTVAGLNTGDAITLPSAGTYKISVFVPTGSASSSITKLSTTEAPLSNGYIIDVVNWSNIKWQSLKDAFKGCTGLTHISAADVPNLSECTSLEAMFQNCTGLTVVPNIEDWNLSNVTSLKSMFAGAISFNQSLNRLNVSHIADFSGMFSGATAFDRPLGEWNLGGITDGNTAMLNMLDNSGMSCASYKETLIGWSMRSSTPNNIRLGAANVNYGNGAAAIRTNLQTNKSWTFVGDLLSAGCDGADASGRYITVWDTRIPTTRTIDLLDIQTNICGNNVTIYWEEVGNTSNNGTLTGLSGNNIRVTGLPHAGVYRLKATIGSDPILSMGWSSPDAGRLIYVEQWGNSPWKTLNGAFLSARNMKIPATDIPNLTQLSDLNPYPYNGPMQSMFNGCSSLTIVPSINSWNMPSAVKKLQYMFQGATSFNQDLSGWDVSHITDMSYMFKEATSFNSPLLWGGKVSNVTDMSYMFQGATSFNQDISGWDVSSVTSMHSMFQGATSFNQPIGLWGSKTANVGNYSYMFQEASSFDQNLGTWTMKSGCYGDILFERSGMGCENYSATFVGWAAQTAFIPTGHFYAGENCLLPLNAAGMAAHKELVRRGAYDMDVHYLAPDCKEDFYETTWSVPNTNTNGDTLTINAIGANFTVVWEAIDSTQNPPAYTAGIDTAANASPGHPYTLRNSWQKVSVPGTVKVKVFAGNGTLTGLYMPGAHSIALTSVDHWGNNKWQRLDSAFIGCERMELKATDVPDLSEVTGASGLDGMFELCGNMTDVHDKIGTWDVSKIKSMKATFKTAARFNRNINSWNVSAVTNMSGMFDNAYSFNQPLADWNVSNVTDMSSMFIRAAKFNQPIGGWNVSKVTNMSSMFARTDAFNQPIGSWNVGAVTNMSGMFDDAKAFNKPLNDWNVSKVTNMNLMFNTAIAFNQPLDRWDVRKATSMGAMFYGATAFNQPLDNWKPFASTMMGEMFGYSGMSCENYSSTLYSWAQNVDSLKPNVLMTLQHNMKYGRIGKYARELIANKKNWQFADDTFDFSCSVIGKVIPSDFVTEWDMSKPAKDTRPDAATTLFTNFLGTNFVVEYINLADPTDKGIVTNANGTLSTPFELTGLRANAKYRLIAYANPGVPGSVFTELNAINSDSKRLTKVNQWGINVWTFLSNAFRFCENMDVTATDTPNLSACQNLNAMFTSCASLVNANGSISGWNTQNVTSMGAMFAGATSFNKPLNFNTKKVTHMGLMFQGATSFNQPLDSFKINAISYMSDMFKDCGMSCENLSSTLDSWKTQAAALNKNNVPLGDISTVSNAYNQTGQAAITALQARSWTITGGTYAEDCITPTSWFTTVWDMSKPTSRTNSPNTTIAFPGFGTNYRIDWEDVDDPTNPAKRGTVTVSTSSGSTSPYYLTVPSGTTKVRIKAHKASGAFDGFRHMPNDTNKTDNKRLIAVEQWGTTKWGAIGLYFAFYRCENMDVTATDKPNLSQCNVLESVFLGCSSLVNTNGSISNWNTENISTMGYIFNGATSFNQPLNNWNTANVTIMNYMFAGAISFNQPLNNWNTANVTNMDGMFLIAASFNKPLNSWNTAKVTSMSGMFSQATSFNKPLNSWNTANVTNMGGMFAGATSFNQPLNSWNTAKVSNMQSMFMGATSFNQRLDSFKINDITTMQNMLQGSGMSCENLSTTLDGWKTQATALGKNNINLGNITTVPNIYNETGKAAINVLKNNHNWTIIGGRFAPDCVSPDYYVSMWDMSRPATTGTATDLVTNLWGSSFRVEWKNLDDGTTGAAIATTTTTPYTITGLTAGKRYRVVAYADPSNPSSTFSKLATMKGGGYTTITDAQRLDSVTQWGTNRWTSLDSAFFLCSRMDVTATDVPDLRRVKDLSFMFGGCDSLVYNPTINTWRTDSITNMQYMFGEDKKFNQPLGSWNTERVTNMHGMFQGTHNFDQDIHNWNTGKVTDMSQMFLRAFKFNQPIGSWSTANVTGMGYMFAFATSFNKPLYWNVEKVTDMTSMFWGADAFDQDLSYWTLKSVTSAGDMFKADLNKGMSCGNYSETLQGWAINPLTKTGLNFLGQDNRQYNMIGKESRDILTKPIANGGKGWTISGDTYDKNCGIDYVWTGAVSTNIADNGNWQGGQHPGSSPILGEFRATVAFDSLAVRDMHIPSLPYTPPGSTPNYIHFYSFGNLINNSNKKVVIEPNGHLHINKWVFGSSTPADVDKIVIKADNTRPNGSLILAGQPCDKPVYATVEMYSKASKSAVSISWTDNIPGSPTHGQLISSSYKWQYIGIPVDGEVVNAFYGSYLRKYDETLNSTDHFYGKWRKLGADETWQPLVPFAGYEVTSRTPKVYVFKGRLLHCPQELTLTRQAAEVTAYTGTDIHKKYYGLGQNIFGNSYTAALRIGDGRLSDAIGSKPIEKTVYIYNTGSIADWNGGSTLTGDGSFLAVPANIAGSPELSAEYISSMQGFLLKFRNDALTDNTGAPEKITIGLHNGSVEPFGGNQRPQRAPQAYPIHGFLKVGLTSRRSVSSISLIEAEGTTDEFDNGWDGMQLNTGRSSSATLFVPSEYGDLQVSTSDNIVGDRFGIVNNGDTTYRLTVIRHRLDNHGELYLYDVATNRYTLLDTDTTVYDFTSEGSGNVDKRFVITDRRNADDPNTAVDEAAEDMSLYGYVDGRHTLVVNNHTAEAGTLTLLDVSGKAVYTSPFGVGFSRHDLSHLPAGVYIARLEASTRRATVKAITMK